jgi:hypothetical protein
MNFYVQHEDSFSRVWIETSLLGRKNDVRATVMMQVVLASSWEYHWWCLATAMEPKRPRLMKDADVGKNFLRDSKILLTRSCSFARFSMCFQSRDSKRVFGQDAEAVISVIRERNVASMIRVARQFIKGPREVSSRRWSLVHLVTWVAAAARRRGHFISQSVLDSDLMFAYELTSCALGHLRANISEDSKRMFPVLTMIL